MDHITPKAHSMEVQDPQQPFGLDKQTATYMALSSQWIEFRAHSHIAFDLSHYLLQLDCF
jgi:hypothetical protein